jgi:acetoin utilization deacetylase AcuC-like enzyme
MRLTTDAFAAMTMDLRQVAEECCGGRVVAVTEGGYDLPALADSLQAVVGALAADRPDAASWPPPGTVPPVRGRAAAAAARAALATFWRL